MILHVLINYVVSSLITQRERWRREGECTSVTGISINGGLMNCNVTSSDLRSYIDGKGKFKEFMI